MTGGIYSSSFSSVLVDLRCICIVCFGASLLLFISSYVFYYCLTFQFGTLAVVMVAEGFLFSLQFFLWTSIHTLLYFP